MVLLMREQPQPGIYYIYGERRYFEFRRYGTSGGYVAYLYDLSEHPETDRCLVGNVYGSALVCYEVGISFVSRVPVDMALFPEPLRDAH